MPPKIQGKTKTSQVWRFFEQIDSEYAKCNMCKSKFSYRTSTTNLNKHLKSKHPTVHFFEDKPNIPTVMETDTITTSGELQEQQSDLSNSQPSTSKQQKLNIDSESVLSPRMLRQVTVETFLPRKISVRSKEFIDQKLLNLFIKDLQPFSIVEDPGFREFIAALNPSYQLPSRDVVSKTLLPAMYEECLTNTKELIQTGKTFCITTDSWSSINTVNFVAVTAHFLDEDFELHSLLLECSSSDIRHTSENLAAELQRVVTNWNITDKIIFAVSDNARNVQKAINDIGWNSFGCIAHTLNLIVKDSLAIQEIGSLIEKVKVIVRHFRKSNIANGKLRTYQENLGKSPLKLIMEVPTRWNSTFYMLQRFIELEEAVKSTVAIIDKEFPPITATEWKVIKELCQVLKLFENASKTLSGERYCTAALVIPMYNGLTNVLEKLSRKEFTQPVKKVINLLSSGLQERLGTVRNSNTFCLSTYLDPRFKNIGFFDDVIAERTKKNVISLMAEKISKKGQILQVNVVEPSEDDQADKELSIWVDYDKKVATSQPKGTSTSRAIIEMQRYMEENITPRQSDTLLWWKQHKQMLPTLSEIAQERLCALASSVPCERLFSKAGQILTERRNRLSDKKVQMLLFLNANKK